MSALSRSARYGALWLAAACVVLLAGCVASAAPAATDPTSPAQVHAPKGRTSPVPAPSGGTSHEVIPPGHSGKVTKVPLSKPADLSGGVTVTVPKVTTFNAKVTTPGELAGPAVAVSVLIHNGSDKPIDVNSAIVLLLDSKGNPGTPTTSAPYRALAGKVPVGKSASGTYVFVLPKDDRTGLTLSVEYLAGAPIAHFIGTIS